MFEGYRHVAEWLTAKKRDMLVTFFNDHASGFFFELYLTFAIGIGEQFEVADEGGGERPLLPIRGNLELSIHLAEQLVNEEFDIATFFGQSLDHGVFSPLPLLLPHEPEWPTALVPVSVNVVQ